MLTVRRFDGPAGEWDAFLGTQPDATHFHRLGWSRVLQGSLRHQSVPLAAVDASGALHGVLPLASVNSLIFGRYLVSMPFVSYGGPLGTDEAVLALTAEAVSRAKLGRAKLLELRSRRELPIGLVPSLRKITVVLDLPNDPAVLLKGFSAKLRSQIRKPEKEGVSVRFGADQVEPFYAVFSRHMRDLGTPVMPRAWFKMIAAEFPEDAWFGCAWLNGAPVACGAGFRWADEFEITWASALKEHNRLAPNMLLYAAFMDRSIEHGVRRFNFGRCTPESGTHRFKRQWGGRDEPLYWYQWSPGAQAPAATPNPDQGMLALGPRLWRHLPLVVANWIGPRVVRGIP